MPAGDAGMLQTIASLDVDSGPRFRYFPQHPSDEELEGAEAQGSQGVSVSLSEHLPLLAEAPDGIKKLRGLILELAVRGKLVPQDPSDEPASELLKRIAAEKARLVAEGTCKKPKANPLDDAESPIFNIAPGWDSAPLGDVVDIIRGITFPSSEKSKTPEAGRVRCLRTSNVQDKIEWGDILYIRSPKAHGFVQPFDTAKAIAKLRGCYLSA